MTINALVDYDGWMHSERWNLSKKDAIEKAYAMVNDSNSSVIKIQLFQGAYSIWSRTNWKKEYACSI